ncbi:hypothetical protein K1719_021536 [Acacia pycnantha]|nr:hypothetical protein K1719_021536 [Acacia pycnantha]
MKTLPLSTVGSRTLTSRLHESQSTAHSLHIRRSTLTVLRSLTDLPLLRFVSIFHSVCTTHTEGNSILCHLNRAVYKE